jgi:hypothetical protein
MRLPVGRVVVLVGIPVQVRVFGGHFARHQDGAIRAFERVGQYQFSAQRAQDADAFGLAFSGMVNVTGMPMAAPKVA